jgi:hypothetical protein
MKRVVVFCGVVVVSVVVLSFVMRNTRPVLVRLPFGTNSAMGSYNWVIFNPFRNRAVERSASAYLDAMQHGDCAKAAMFSKNIVLPNNFICEQMQAEYHGYRGAFVQPLRDRTESGSDVVLYYSRNGYEGNWVALRKFGDDWRVVELSKFW